MARYSSSFTAREGSGRCNDVIGPTANRLSKITVSVKSPADLAWPLHLIITVLLPSPPLEWLLAREGPEKTRVMCQACTCNVRRTLLVFALTYRRPLHVFQHAGHAIMHLFCTAQLSLWNRDIPWNIHPITLSIFVTPCTCSTAMPLFHLTVLLRLKTIPFLLSRFVHL